MKNKHSLSFYLFLVLVVFSPLACGPTRSLTRATQKLTPITNALVGILQTSAETIVVAPIVAVETSFSADEYARAGGDIGQWKKIAAGQLNVITERCLHDALGGYKNFKLIDRASIEKIFSDLKLSMAVSSDERLILGKMLGATHLVFAEVYRTPNSTSKDPTDVKDTYTTRLVDVVTGEVLATDIQPH